MEKSVVLDAGFVRVVYDGGSVWSSKRVDGFYQSDVWSEFVRGVQTTYAAAVQIKLINLLIKVHIRT